MIVDDKEFRLLTGKSPQQKSDAVDKIEAALKAIAQSMAMIRHDITVQAPNVSLSPKIEVAPSDVNLGSLEIEIPPVEIKPREDRSWEFNVERDEDGRLKRIIAKPL
jgi:hypothetical protein